MQFIFHRGFHNAKGEENKIEALKKGLENAQSIGIETDIRQTKDKVLVLYHDALFKGKLVPNVLYKEMQKEDVPRLIDLLKIDTNKILLLEIKDFKIDVQSLIKILNKYPRRIYLMSFNNQVINKIAKLKTKYKLGILNYVFNSEDNYPYDFICLLNDLLTPSMITKFQKLNIEIISYGIRNKENLKYSQLTYIINNEILNDSTKR